MEKNKKDYLSAALSYQILVCVILFGVLFALNKINSDYIKDLKSEFFDNIQENTIIEKAENFKNKDSQSETTNVTSDIENETINNIQEALIPKVGTGGMDTDINDVSSIPDNVSVNSYSLNRKMHLPLKGTVTSEYGARIHPIKGNLSFHSGIDIAANKGEPISAAFDGVVTEAEYDEWNGYHLKIQHDNGVMTVYCHCDELLVKKGENISAGEIVAKVGSTGSSTGPHLHFELRINDVCYDPALAIKEAVDAV